MKQSWELLDIARLPLDIALSCMTTSHTNTVAQQCLLIQVWHSECKTAFKILSWPLCCPIKTLELARGPRLCTSSWCEDHCLHFFLATLADRAELTLPSLLRFLISALQLDLSWNVRQSDSPIWQFQNSLLSHYNHFQSLNLYFVIKVKFEFDSEKNQKFASL